MQYIVKFEPWFGTPFFGGLSHGSENLQSHGSGTPSLRFEFEPWLRAPFFLGGGFEPWLGNSFLGVRAMAQDPIFGGFEPWLGTPFFGGHEPWLWTYFFGC